MAIANVALTDTFDQWRLKTNQIILYTGGIENKANAAYLVANSSYDTANNAYDVTNNTFDMVNANAAILNTAYAAVNANAAILNSAYRTANACYILGNSAYDLLNVAFNTGNACYTSSNAGYDVANASYHLANVLYDIANNTTGNTTQIFVDIADLRDLTNSAFNTTNASFIKTNSNFTVTNAAYTMANANYVVTNAAYTMGNANYIVTNAAFNTANAALPNTSGAVFAGNLTLTGNLGLGEAASGLRLNLLGDMRATGNVELGQGTNNTIIFNGNKVRLTNTVTFGSTTSNTLFIDPVNSRVAIGNTNPPAGSNLFVQTANINSVLWAGGVNVAPTLFNASNTSNLGFTTANAAFDKLNTAFTVTNASYTLANANFVRITNAYQLANAAIANTGGTMSGDLTVYRSGSPTTGYVFLDQSRNHSIGFDGSNYHMPAGQLYVNGSKVWNQDNDGSGSGLDADYVDGLSPSVSASGSTICSRDGNGDTNFRYMNASYVNSSDDVSGGNITYIMGKFGDNYYRSATAAKVAAFISGQSMNITGTSNNIRDYSINQNLHTAADPTFGYVYAYKMIDRDDNGYYIDPNYISRLNDVRPNVVYLPDNVGYRLWGGSGDPSCRFGNIYCDFVGSYGNITAYMPSDIKLKVNINLLSGAVDKVKALRGVEFDWTDEYIEEQGGEDGYFVRKHDVGVIAQEVEAVLPEVVATRPDGTKAVRYEKIVPLLIEAIKEQQKMIEELQKKVGK